MARSKKTKVTSAEEKELRYPDLLPSITLLKKRLEEDNNEHEVVRKWLTILEKTEREMRHLERIENLSGALKRPTEE